jgi:hypothetical protein
MEITLFFQPLLLLAVAAVLVVIPLILMALVAVLAVAMGTTE